MLKITTEHYFINSNKADKISKLKNGNTIIDIIVHNNSSIHTIDIHFAKNTSIAEIFETGRLVEYILSK